MGILESFADDKRADAVGDRNSAEPGILSSYQDYISSAGKGHWGRSNNPKTKRQRLASLHSISRRRNYGAALHHQQPWRDFLHLSTESGPDCSQETRGGYAR